MCGGCKFTCAWCKIMCAWWGLGERGVSLCGRGLLWVRVVRFEGAWCHLHATVGLVLSFVVQNTWFKLECIFHITVNRK